MRKKRSGLRVALSNSVRTQDFHIPWGDAVVSTLITAGILLLLFKVFTSVSLSLPGILAAVFAFELILLSLYTTAIGKWVLPVGVVLTAGACILLKGDVIAGFGALANDAVHFLTEKTGLIILDFKVADNGKILWALCPLTALLALFISRSVWCGAFLPVLPLVLPLYLMVMIGFLPCGLECGILIIGLVLLLMQRTAGRQGAANSLRGLPSHLIPVILCLALCLVPAYLADGKLKTNAMESLEELLHERLYDSPSNSMPEGRLKNLRAWNKSDTPAIELTMEEPEKLYLRGAVYEVYTGKQWKAVPTDEKAEYQDLFYWLHKSGFYGQGQIGIASKYTTQAEPLKMRVRNLTACKEHGYYPYAVYGAKKPNESLIGDSRLPVEEELKYLKGSVPEWYEIQKNLSSAQGRENIAEYLTLEQAYGEYVTKVDLQIPLETWMVLDRQLGQSDEEKSILEIREIILAYLEKNMSYDEKIRTMSGNGDFLQYTLEKSGRGYSVHYATAAVMMLRYMGVPARYVEGYFLSAEDAKKYMSGETITLTEEYAHAWAEYYVNGVGFVPFEVTPGYIDDEEIEMGGSGASEDNTYAANPQKFAQVQRPERLEEREQEMEIFSFNPQYLLAIPVLLILLLILLICKRRLRLKRKLKTIDEADIRDSITMRFGYASCLLSHSTVRLPEETAKAEMLNREALFSNHEMTHAQKETVDEYAQNVLKTCKKNWNWREKIRYKLWECLY
ncbi:MAG: transglutaminase domain-containing protein [Eubacteriales bacterium]|nr:transglutaminase domain-containing protein [Eubacteriales bacterium]